MFLQKRKIDDFIQNSIYCALYNEKGTNVQAKQIANMAIDVVPSNNSSPGPRKGSLGILNDTMSDYRLRHRAV